MPTHTYRGPHAPALALHAAQAEALGSPSQPLPPRSTWIGCAWCMILSRRLSSKPHTPFGFFIASLRCRQCVAYAHVQTCLYIPTGTVVCCYDCCLPRLSYTRLGGVYGHTTLSNSRWSTTCTWPCTTRSHLQRHLLLERTELHACRLLIPSSCASPGLDGRLGG